MEKKIIPFILMWLISFVAYPQTAITQADLPSLNDTLRYSIANHTPGIDFQETGENFTWDFSMLLPLDQGVEQYISVSSYNTLLGFVFGSSSFASPIDGQLPLEEVEADANDFHAVYLKNEQAFTQEGYFFSMDDVPVPLKYTSKDVIYRLPIEYDQYDSTAFAANLASGDTIFYARQGYRINETDGWGMITTPYGRFDCLRVKTTLYEEDSLYMASLPEPLSIKRTTIIFKWLAKDEKFPVMEASFSLSDDGTLIPFSLRYRDVYRLISEAPVAGFYAEDTTPMINETVKFYNTSTPDHTFNTYQWLIEPMEVEFLEVTSASSAEPSVIFKEPGEYTVTLVAHNDAGSDTLIKIDYIQVSDTLTSISNIPTENISSTVFIKDYGNILRINYKRKPSLAIIYDMTGKQMMHINSPTRHINISGLNSGNYILQLIRNTPAIESEAIKFIKP